MKDLWSQVFEVLFKRGFTQPTPQDTEIISLRITPMHPFDYTGSGKLKTREQGLCNKGRILLSSSRLLSTPEKGLPWNWLFPDQIAKKDLFLKIISQTNHKHSFRSSHASQPSLSRRAFISGKTVRTEHKRALGNNQAIKVKCRILWSALKLNKQALKSLRNQPWEAV